jgi:hypothetical protein
VLSKDLSFIRQFGTCAFFSICVKFRSGRDIQSSVFVLSTLRSLLVLEFDYTAGVGFGASLKLFGLTSSGTHFLPEAMQD